MLTLACMLPVTPLPLAHSHEAGSTEHVVRNQCGVLDDLGILDELGVLDTLSAGGERDAGDELAALVGPSAPGEETSITRKCAVGMLCRTCPWRRACQLHLCSCVAIDTASS